MMFCSIQIQNVGVAKWVSAKWVSRQLGGDEKVDQLHINAKEVKKIIMKKIAMKSLRKSLSEVLPLSLEEHILDNILGHFNLLDESLKLETTAEEEDKPMLSSLYHKLSQVYNKIRNNLFFSHNYNYNSLTPEVIDQLQEILAELQREDGIGGETMEETMEECEGLEIMEEGEGGEIMGGYEGQVEVEVEDNDEVEIGGEDEEEGNQLEKI